MRVKQRKASIPQHQKDKKEWTSLLDESYHISNFLNRDFDGRSELGQYMSKFQSFLHLL